MKILNLLLTLVVSLFVYFQSFADTISVKDAKQVAKNFIIETSNLYYQKDRNNVDLELITSKKDTNNEPYYYMFNIQPEGFIIVSAEDVFNPILGYNLTGKMDSNSNNPAFESWMKYYTDYIDYIRSNKLTQTEEMKQRWKKYNTHDFDLSKSVAGDDIEPLLTNLWNQDYPYNYFCPEDEEGPGGRVYAGCVATAMSMIMYHYKYPKQGMGTHSYYADNYGYLTVNYGATEYQWDAMDDQIGLGGNLQTIFSVAELQYHCGVSVNMMYSPDGSGAYSYDVPNAVKSYFGYNDAEYVESDYYTTSQWNNLLTEQLENLHPMYYSGYSDDGGHAFCLDGKQGNDMFHFNFGWSGYNNGFYYLEGSGAVGGFNGGQAAVINFYPPESEYPYTCSNKTLNNGGGVINNNEMPYKPYAKNLDCRWLLVPASVNDSVQQFDFEFLHLNIQDGDQVTIYDGETEEAPIIGTYSGNVIPEKFNSTNDTVLVVFTSDNNESEHDGFRLRYREKNPKYCLGLTNYTEPEGTISDGSGKFYYANNNVCKYAIKPEGATKLTLTFDKFDLAEGDNLIIFQTNPTQMIANLNHESNPTSIISNSGSMMILFKTDSFFNADGFEARYVTEGIDVEATEKFSKFQLYPNPASEKLTLNMRIKDEAKVMVSIHNIDGKVVAKDLLHNIAGTFYKEIDVSDLMPGIYLMVVETSEGAINKRFMVK